MRAQGELNMKGQYLKNKIYCGVEECTRGKRKGEVECNKLSLIKEGRKSFYNGRKGGGGDERK